jgi:hypothetical protein
VRAGLAAGQAGALLFADGGFWGREYLASMESLNVELVTPDKHQPGERPPAEVAKARIRLVIESVLSTLKRQMRMEMHLAKTAAGPPSGSPSDCWLSPSVSTSTP